MSDFYALITEETVQLLSNPAVFSPNPKTGSTPALGILNEYISKMEIEPRTEFYRGLLQISPDKRPFVSHVLVAIARMFPEKGSMLLSQHFMQGLICISYLANCCRDLAAKKCKFCPAVVRRTNVAVSELHAVDQRFLQDDGKTAWQEFIVETKLMSDGHGALAPKLTATPSGPLKVEAGKSGRSRWNTDEAKTIGLEQCPHQRSLFGCKYGKKCVGVHAYPNGSATASLTGDASRIVKLVSVGNGRWKVPDDAAPAAAAVTTSVDLAQELADLRRQLLVLQVAETKRELAEAKQSASAASAASAPAPAPAPVHADGAVPAHVEAARKQRLMRKERRNGRDAQ